MEDLSPTKGEQPASRPCKPCQIDRFCTAFRARLEAYMDQNAVRSQSFAYKLEPSGVLYHQYGNPSSGFVCKIRRCDCMAENFGRCLRPCQRSTFGTCLLQIRSLAGVESISSLHLVLQHIAQFQTLSCAYLISNNRQYTRLRCLGRN